jgi:hypothetical protein
VKWAGTDRQADDDTITSAQWALVHEVRLRGFVENAEPDGANALVAVGYATLRTAKLVITPAGRAAHAIWARCPPGTEEEERVARAFERFLLLNVELLQLCSDWQVTRGGTANDHRDAAYDWAVIKRLTALDERAGAVARHAGTAVPRLAVYRARLRAARTRVEAGEHEWFTSPRIDSYHTVWMQWHEDLLISLGRERDAHGS